MLLDLSLFSLIWRAFGSRSKWRREKIDLDVIEGSNLVFWLFWYFLQVHSGKFLWGDFSTLICQTVAPKEVDSYSSTLIDLDVIEGSNLSLFSCFLIFLYFCKVTMAKDRDWMYKSRIEPPFVQNVKKKFLLVAQKHRLSLGRKCMHCPCNQCKNRFLEEDNVGFHQGSEVHCVEVSRQTRSECRYHLKVNDISGGWWGQQPSSSSKAVDDGGQQPPS